MRKQDFLIELIKSLTPNELQYFKRFSNIQSGEKNYLKLFDALQGVDDYDANTLSKKLGTSPDLLSKHKYYLNQVLLTSLRNIQQENSGSVIRRLIDEAWLLLERRQFSYALNLAEKGLVQAWETEEFEHIGALLKIKAGCIDHLEQKQDTQQITTGYSKASACEAELFEIGMLRKAINRIEVARNPSSQLKKLMAHKLITGGVHKLHSLRAQTDWFDIMVRYFSLIGNGKAMLDISKQEVGHYARHAKIKTIDPIAYVVAFSRLANAHLDLGNLPAAMQAINKFEAALNDASLSINPVRIASLKYYSAFITTFLLGRMRRYDEAIPIHKKNYANRLNRPVSEQYAVIYEYAAALFYTGKIAEATQLIDELLRIKDDVRIDLKIAARLLLVMIQLSSQDFALVPYTIKAAKTWIKRQNFDAPADLDIFFKHTRAIALEVPLQRKEHLEELKKALDDGSLNQLKAVLNLEGWLKQMLSEKRV